MKAFLVLAICLTIGTVASAQRYYTNRDLMAKYRDNPEAYHELKLARSNSLAGSIFIRTGAFCVGWAVGTAIGGGKPIWGLAAAGGGLIFIGIPFFSAGHRHLVAATRIYNDGLRRKASLNVGMGPKGLGFRLAF